jgi:hypothetical protein
MVLNSSLHKRAFIGNTTTWKYNQHFDVLRNVEVLLIFFNIRKLRIDRYISGSCSPVNPNLSYYWLPTLAQIVQHYVFQVVVYPTKIAVCFLHNPNVKRYFVVVSIFSQPNQLQAQHRLQLQLRRMLPWQDSTHIHIFPPPNLIQHRKITHWQQVLQTSAKSCRSVQ